MKNMRLTSEVKLYLIFGVLTTLVNFILFYFARQVLDVATLPSNIFAWMGAVLFAYITNKLWVFQVSQSRIGGVCKELITFFVARLASGVVDTVIVVVAIEAMGWNSLWVKIGANILVIVMNWFMSKYIVFRQYNEI